MAEAHAIGQHKLSISITRKTRGDHIVSNYAIERYFPTRRSTLEAEAQILATITNADDRVVKDGEDEEDEVGQQEKGTSELNLKKMLRRKEDNDGSTALRSPLRQTD